jgi:hypothetical protein
MMVDKPTIPQVLDKFVAYLSRPENSCGGSLHIITDDDNVQDYHVQGCIEYAHQRGDAEGAELAEILLRMSKTQRLKIGSAARRVIDAMDEGDAG